METIVTTAGIAMYPIYNILSHCPSVFYSTSRTTQQNLVAIKVDLQRCSTVRLTHASNNANSIRQLFFPTPNLDSFTVQRARMAHSPQKYYDQTCPTIVDDGHKI